MLRLWYNSDCFIQITYFWKWGATMDSIISRYEKIQHNEGVEEFNKGNSMESNVATILGCCLGSHEVDGLPYHFWE